jgi:hypothetical protein
VVIPLAAWFDQYYEKTAERRASLQPVATTSAKLLSLSREEIFAGTDQLIKLSTEMVSGIIDTIKEIA